MGAAQAIVQTAAIVVEEVVVAVRTVADLALVALVALVAVAALAALVAVEAAIWEEEDNLDFELRILKF